MAAPAPKTKATQLLEELSCVSRQNTALSEFKANKYLREINKLLESKVDIAYLWICKGFVYSLSNQPKQMYEAFANAQKLGASDSLSMFNQATQYILYGYYDEAIDALCLNYGKVAQGQLERVALATFAYHKIEQKNLTAETKEILRVRKARLKDLEIDVDQAHKFMNIFYDLMRKQKIRYGLVRHNIYNEEEYYLHFEAVADNDLTQSVLNEFDQYVADHPELYEINAKINIILTPISSIWHNSAA
ncbi:hypothetical protein [Acinetobacter guillouiae]|uniref:Uncharacterized protein n=1 Tax=Acinetobacter guillouiae NIPH 991 TaxID=1217656 RepID=N8YAV3_ACIGI|nr:hypothetical protein [Acinetobacter guillouiae]ENV16445.1 hypothetical protein F964_03380 [Acinetobacter guillouiae NIPH 991]